MAKKIVKSYKELLCIIRQSIEQYEEIRLVNLLITCKVNTYNLMGKRNITMDMSTNTIRVDYPVIIEGIECDELVFDHLSFNKDVVFSITSKSTIGRLSFYDCYFNGTKNESLNITNITCNEFDMIHCFSRANVSLDCFECKGNFNVENVDIKGGVEFRNFRLLPKKDTEFYFEGRISHDVKFSNCLLSKKTTVNVEARGSIIYEYINFDTKEVVDNNSKVLRLGEICMSGTTIGKQLVFLSCNIGTIDMINVNVNSISEFDFRYNRLMNQAATILRNGALLRNDDISYSKYTADIYDDCLRAISIRKLRKKIHILERLSSATKNDIEEFKKIEHENNKKNRKWKTVEWLWLLLMNLFSEEGLLLWLNKYSNNYNRSWFRGIKFTLIIALIAYFALNYFGMQQPFFEIDWHFNGFGEVLVGYLSLLDIFNLIGSSTMFELTPIGKLLMFLFKIIIAYGEWQTIYAFYKYKK